VIFYKELLGLTDKKPFECVGEILEVRQAFLMLTDYSSYFHEEVYYFIKKLSDENLIETAMYNYQKNHQNLIPKIFENIIKNI
jgi:hypothetical protein